MNLAVITPVYGQPDHTRLMLNHLWSEDAMAYGEDETYIVDNLGSWEMYREEIIVRPGMNLRWCKGTNLGLRLALNAGFDAYVCLNNDVKLSHGFVDGIRQALIANPLIDVLGPMYDDVWEQQKGSYQGRADRYTPLPMESKVNFVDGACIVLTASCISKHGLLDEQYFGEFGWGADIDYCYRVRNAGGQVAVTHRSYFNHLREGTAKKLQIDYKALAGEEMNAGMQAKYGNNWRDIVY